MESSTIASRRLPHALIAGAILSTLAVSLPGASAETLYLRSGSGQGDGAGSSSLTSPLTGSGAVGWASSPEAAGPGAAAESGNDYITTTGLQLRSPNSGTFTFAGDSLTMNAGSRLLLKSVDGTMTINNLILNGGTVDYTGGGASKSTLAGTILLQAESTIGGGHDPGVIKTLVVSSTITGTANVNYNSSSLQGILQLTGTSNYTGASSIVRGTVLIDGNNSGATGNVTVAAQATLGGVGRVGGATTVNGVLAAGSEGVGVLRFEQSLTLTGTANSVFEIASGARGTGYDGVTVVGLLNYDGTLTLTMNALVANGTYDLFSFDVQQGSLDAVTFAGSAYTGAFSQSGVGVWSAQSSSGQTFTFSQETGNLTVIPEPSTMGAVLLGAAGMFFFGRRRRSVAMLACGAVMAVSSIQAETELWKEDFAGASGSGDELLTLHRQGGSEYRSGKITFGDSTREYSFYCKGPDDPWTQTLSVEDGAVGDSRGMVYTNVTGSDVAFGGIAVPLDLGWQPGSVTEEMVKGLQVMADYQGGIGFRHSVNIRLYIGKDDQAVNLSIFGKAQDTPGTLILNVGEKATPEQIASMTEQLNAGEQLSLGFYLPGGSEPGGKIAYANIVVTSTAE